MFRTHMQEHLFHVTRPFEIPGEGIAAMQGAFKIMQGNSPAIVHLCINIIHRRASLNAPEAEP